MATNYFQEQYDRMQEGPALLDRGAMSTMDQMPRNQASAPSQNDMALNAALNGKTMPVTMKTSTEQNLQEKPLGEALPEPAEQLAGSDRISNDTYISIRRQLMDKANPTPLPGRSRLNIEQMKQQKFASSVLESLGDNLQHLTNDELKTLKQSAMRSSTEMSMLPDPQFQNRMKRFTDTVGKRREDELKSMESQTALNKEARAKLALEKDTAAVETERRIYEATGVQVNQNLLDAAVNDADKQAQLNQVMAELIKQNKFSEVYEVGIKAQIARDNAAISDAASADELRDAKTKAAAADIALRHAQTEIGKSAAKRMAELETAITAYNNNPDDKAARQSLSEVYGRVAEIGSLDRIAKGDDSTLDKRITFAYNTSRMTATALAAVNDRWARALEKVNARDDLTDVMRTEQIAKVDALYRPDADRLKELNAKSDKLVVDLTNEYNKTSGQRIASEMGQRSINQPALYDPNAAAASFGSNAEQETMQPTTVEPIASQPAEFVATPATNLPTAEQTAEWNKTEISSKYKGLDYEINPDNTVQGPKIKDHDPKELDQAGQIIMDKFQPENIKLGEESPERFERQTKRLLEKAFPTYGPKRIDDMYVIGLETYIPKAEKKIEAIRADVKIKTERDVTRGLWKVKRDLRHREEILDNLKGELERLKKRR